MKLKIVKDLQFLILATIKTKKTLWIRGRRSASYNGFNRLHANVIEAVEQKWARKYSMCWSVITPKVQWIRACSKGKFLFWIFKRKKDFSHDDQKKVNTKRIELAKKHNNCVNVWIKKRENKMWKMCFFLFPEQKYKFNIPLYASFIYFHIIFTEKLKNFMRTFLLYFFCHFIEP